MVSIERTEKYKRRGKERIELIFSGDITQKGYDKKRTGLLKPFLLAQRGQIIDLLSDLSIHESILFQFDTYTVGVYSNIDRVPRDR